jgi:hypothetical protein
MFALLLISAAMLLEEGAASLGKRAVAEKKESIYSYGFLNAFWLLMFMLLSVLYLGKPFTFSLNSLPYFIPRMLIEVVQAHLLVRAIIESDRSTYAFLRIITIPILLAIDIALGYPISPLQISGIIVIFLALVLLLSSHTLSTKGSKYVLATALIAPIGLSLYKYDITHFNSVAAEQTIVYLGVITYFTIGAWYHGRERTWRYLLHQRFEFQSMLQGLGAALLSYSFALVPASIALTFGRAATTLWAIIFGNIYFHESKTKQKFLGYSLLAIALVIVALGTK